VPEISRFFGIAIAIVYDPAGAPRFVACAGEHTVAVEIETGAVLGRFPPRALGLVLEWRHRHVDALRENWRLASTRRPLYAVPPLE
jgi:phosphomannomutase